MLVRMQDDSGFNNMVIILTFTILKSKQLRMRRCYALWPGIHIPLAYGSFDSWSVVSTHSPAPTFHSCPRETGEKEGHGDYFLGLHGEIVHLTSSHIHGPALGRTWRWQIKSTDSGIRLLGFTSQLCRFCKLFDLSVS